MSKEFKSAMLLTSALIAVNGNIDLLGRGPFEMQKKPWKPEFTEAELAHIRSLPKKEKKKAVQELRAKYARERREPNNRG